MREIEEKEDSRSRSAAGEAAEECRKEGRKGRLPGLFGLGSRAVTRFVARLEPDGSEVDANAGRISSRLYPARTPYMYTHIYVYMCMCTCTFRVFCRTAAHDGPARIYSAGPTTDDDDDFSPFHGPVEDRANSVLPLNAAGLTERNGMKIRWW